MLKRYVAARGLGRGSIEPPDPVVIRATRLPATGDVVDSARPRFAEARVLLYWVRSEPAREVNEWTG
jgi:hypothetical protein